VITLPPDLKAKVLKNLMAMNFTLEESKILASYLEGKENNAIATELGITRRRVINLAHAISKRLNVNSRGRLILKLVHLGALK
jgi:DNA-binding NarL/FixJ family response regulator